MDPHGGAARALRPLLPRLEPVRGPPDPDEVIQLPPPRAHTKIACDGCRRRKIKCNGRRPVCSVCAANGGICVYYLSADPNESRPSAIKRKYGEAQDRVSSHEQLYHLLKTRTQPEVTEILHRIRAGIDVESILRYVRDGDLLLQLHLFPETRLRYTFPEFASWPTVFRDPTDPYLEAQLLDFDAGPHSQRHGISSAPRPAVPSPHLHIYQIPYHAAQMVDPRLSSVKAAMWTSVTNDDALFSQLLAVYFQFEYSRTRLFQKDLFLDDLVRGRRRFCSPLLVNCILANAAHGLTSDPHRVEFWAPRSLPYAFLAEAKRLWDIEANGEPRLTTIHAALSLTLRYGADGADKIGLPFMLKALELAEQMDLFTRTEKGDSKMSLARTFTAWAVFSYQGMTLYYMHRAPLASIPPVTPLPDYASISKLTGEVHVKYPVQPYLTPIHLGVAFRAQIELNLIMLEINQTACDAGTPGTAPPTLRQALEFYHRLESWYRALPQELQPSRVVMPHHLQIHMEYCLVLINLFEPWMNGPDADLLVGPSASSPREPQPDGSNHTTIRDIGTRARARLETLIRIYYLRHSFDALDVMLIMFLLLLGSISVRVLTSPPQPSSPPQPQSQPPSSTTTTTTPPNKPTNPPNRNASTFLLCAKGLHDQGRNQYLGTLMFDLLSRLVDGAADSALRADLARVAAEFRGVGVKREYVHMEWPVYRWVDGEGRGLGVLVGGGEDGGEGGIVGDGDGDSVESGGGDGGGGS
ncbi:uncharacterized protein B0H64DRAFT_364455 [Chaetomium fimeti]|uniref:Zn(2)-C6 fungal-type domain-containing protein n=1 Tax=Chaetomium fimeti TaxID=1854472 RepID=A0AAE0HDN2_9PEZI|nr:hypothetical protein B0H64DRAFT_364455 [Chaetomium fimeti]